MRTSKDYTIANFRGYGELTVPAGTRITHNTACGYDEKYNFVADLSFMPGTTATNLAKHEAYYYGIDIPKEFIEEAH